MKRFAGWIVATLAAGAAMAADEGQYTQGLPPPGDDPSYYVTLPTDKGELWPFSYTLGYQLGLRVHGDVPEVDTDAFVEAFREAVGGRVPQLTESQMRKAMADFNERMQAKLMAARAQLADENLAKSKAFLAENGKRAGVKKTASGLQYEILQRGEKKGTTPTRGDVVTVNYHGTLPDGTVFDSTQGAEPATFPLKSVIAGWVEGVQLMTRGAKYRFYLPPELAYGAQGQGDAIAPNQALVFEIELLDFKPLEGTDPALAP